MSISEWYKRWRHGRGFGVHSPFAYRMVREVLRPSGEYAYYAYDEVKRLIHDFAVDMELDEALMLYRILIYLRPATVTVFSDDSGEFLRKLVNIALPEARIDDMTYAEMLICTDAKCHGEPIPRYAYFTNTHNSMIDDMWARMGNGHLYRNPHRALLVSNPCVAKQEFDIRF